MVVQADWPVAVPQVTLAGNAAVGLGPMRIKPRLGSVDEPTTVVAPITTESIPLKFAFLMVKLAAPVDTVIVAPLSVARFEPPKLPLPESTRAAVAVPPAVIVGMTPQTFTHLKCPSGQVPNTRNWPAGDPESPRTFVEVIPAESASGTPMQKGSEFRETPVDPPL